MAGDAAMLLLMLLCGIAHAASPALTTVVPRGAQRGAEVELTLSGDRLNDAQEVLLYQPGLSVKKLVATTQQVKAQLAVAADAPLGEHCLRVRTATGVSELRTFWVGALPTVDEKEPNTDLAQPQKIDLDVTVAAAVDNEDVDYFAVQLKKGQRLTAEVEGIRLGETMFDPYLAILDANRFELAACDDSALLVQDPVASIVAPADGNYLIQVRDSAYGGSASCRYRLHVGTFPRPRVAFPAGGQAGTELKVQLVGDANGPMSQTVRLPNDGRVEHRLFAEQDGKLAPSANVVRVSTFPNVLEAESNNEPKSATAVAGGIPAALNGIIADKGDVDFFRLTGKKNQVIDIHAYARRVRSPLDVVLCVCDVNGNPLANNDDTGGPDGYLRFTVPADADYLVKVTDHLGAGGAEYVYRIEARPVQPKLVVTIPPVANNSQERQTIVVPRGNRFATLVRATRSDFASELKIEARELPMGVSMAAENMAAGLDVVPVVFEAAADPPNSGRTFELVAKCVDEKVAVVSEFQQAADLIVFGNQVVYYQARVGRPVLAVTDEAPFKLSIVQPKVPLVQSGSMQLRVVAERKEGFTAPITLAMLFNPPGVSAGGATMAEKTNEAVLPLNASGDAQVRKWKICVIGSADVGGPLWVSTQLAELEIAPPFVAGKLEMATVEQGKSTQVLCNLEQKRPFDGKATVQLLGLPPNASAPQREITSSDSKAIFDVQTDPKSPAGSHNTMFCVATVTQNGEPIAQSIAGGGVLRIDAPPPAPAPVAAAPAPVQETATPTTAPAAPVSRLQKLRIEQAARTEARPQ
jgi:hypothetical protein